MLSRTARSLAGTLVPFMLSAYAAFSLSLEVGQLAERFQAPVAAVLLAIPIDFIGGAVGGVLLGYVADRWGRRTSLIISSLLFSVPILAAAGARALWELYALWFLVGIGVNSQNGVTYAVLVETLRSSRGSVGGFTQGLYFIGFLLDVVTHGLAPGPSRFFTYVGLLSLALGLPLSAVVPETVAAMRGQRQPGLRSMGRRLAMLTAALSTITVGAFMFSVPLLSVTPSFVASMHIGEGALEVITFIGFLGFVVGGLLSDMLGRLRVQLAFSAAGLAASLLLVYMGEGLPGAAALAFMFFFSGYFSFIGVWAGESYPPQYRATATNLVFLVGRVVGGFSAIIAAGLYPSSLRVGTALTCAIGNMLAVIGGILYIMYGGYGARGR